MRPVILCIDDEEPSLAPLVQKLHRSLGDRYDIQLSSSGQTPELLNVLQAENLELPLVIMGQLSSDLTPESLLTAIHHAFSHTVPVVLTKHQPAEPIVTNEAPPSRYNLPHPWDEAELLLTLTAALSDYEQQTAVSPATFIHSKTNRDRSNKDHALLQATLDATVDGILALDCDGQITHFNQALLNLFAPAYWASTQLRRSHDDHASLSLRSDPHESLHSNREQIIPLLTQWLQSSPQLWEQLMTQRFSQGRSAPSEAAVSQAIAEAKGLCEPHITSIRLANGRSLEYQSQLQWVGNQIVGQVWSFHDVTERQRNEALIRYQAHHDFLTGIANRFKFNDVLDEMLAQAAEEQTELAVLFIDLDRFKIINDSLGHSIGDELLKHFVQRLQRIRRPGELMARWGGDEFTMVVGNLAETDGATQAARRILSILQRPFEVQGHQLRINVSIGIAQYPQDGTSAELLLKRADLALYEVKAEGRNGYQHYHPQLDKKGQALFAIESALHKALERNELSLHYQPQLDSNTGQITHMEALLRWQHPTLGNIPPQQFITIAEQNGLIFSLGEWVLTEACRQTKAWQRMGFETLKMCVNLSPLQLSQTNLPQMIQQVLHKTGLDPQWLELEITESAALRNEHVIKDVLDSLQQLGLELALDDFGTGYSSLSYAKQLPFDTLKLDQSFVRDLMTNHSDGVIVQAVLAMGKGLQRRVVAEGVETEALRDLLQSWGCRYLQGYWFSRPLPTQQATDLLLQQQQSFMQVTEAKV